MANIEELLKQRKALEDQIKAVQQAERQDAIKKIKELVANYDIDLSKDLAPSRKAGGPSSSKGNPVAVKYRNSATGDTWTGRGLTPKWLKEQMEAGKKLEDFAV